jgi:hypothetical protein
MRLSRGRGGLLLSIDDASFWKRGKADVDPAFVKQTMAAMVGRRSGAARPGFRNAREATSRLVARATPMNWS